MKPPCILTYGVCPPPLRHSSPLFALFKPQVILFSQGFKTAETLAGKIVLLFDLCDAQLSDQPHYDFGLRSLKSVLMSAGDIKREAREARQRLESGEAAGGEGVEVDEVKIESKADGGGMGGDENLDGAERMMLIRSMSENMVPKLVAEDVPLFSLLLGGVFPGCEMTNMDAHVLRTHIDALCAAQHLVTGQRWIEKMLQLHQIQHLRHGVMMVGPSGTGKTACWRVLLEAMTLVDGVKGEAHVIDPKALSKAELYGTLDQTTLEWTDGVFTKILRNILNNVRGEMERRHWIVFDGDVDPEWAENLNSVLDDTKLLTLPSGERLAIPPNVRLMFEVDSLRYATLATVSRCGMVWFSDDTIPDGDLFSNYLDKLAEEPLLGMSGSTSADQKEHLPVQEQCVDVLRPYFDTEGEGSLVSHALAAALQLKHVMEPSRQRLVDSMFSLVARGVCYVLEYNDRHAQFPMTPEHLDKFISKWLIFALLWGFSGSAGLEDRWKLGDTLKRVATIPLPAVLAAATEDGDKLIDYQVQVDDAEWVLWKSGLSDVDLDSHHVLSTDVVITTEDTVRHVEVLRGWLAEHKPLILCGPPGSGKTMTLTSVLNTMDDMVKADLNFSSSASPELILKVFDQYCDYHSERGGITLSPVTPGKWLVVFCDEINLPAEDDYGTQQVITFLRQLTEQNGFYRPKDKAWVTLKRIQFVGACNPPTDPGRVPMSQRFLRHAPLMLVDYPSPHSLRQIYGTFNRALVKLHVGVRPYAEPLTEAMVQFYSANQHRFLPDDQPHYIYSPRELSRWMRALYEAMEPLDDLDLPGLVRLWLHEGLRLFHDRLVTDEERQWCEDKADEVATACFPGDGAVIREALQRPVLYSSWLSRMYLSVDRQELRDHVQVRESESRGQSL